MSRLFQLLLRPSTECSYSRLNSKKKGRGFCLESSPVFLCLKGSAPLTELAYCPGVAVLAEVAAVAFGTLM